MHIIMTTNRGFLSAGKISNFATSVAVQKLRYNTLLPIRTSDNLIERQAGKNLRKSRLKRSAYSVPIHI